MFTGLIEEIGIIQNITLQGQSGTLSIHAQTVLENTKIGDSIAVDGVCLTVVSLSGRRFSADIMAETLHRSTLGKLTSGSSINLERAMPADGRFGGHIVSGHIDGVGKIKSISAQANATLYTIETNLASQMIEKGSISIDGISLTVISAQTNTFHVGVIPHTKNATTLSMKRIGDTVNLETDLIGKYVRNFLQQNHTTKNKSITPEFLAHHGF